VVIRVADARNTSAPADFVSLKFTTVFL